MLAVSPYGGQWAPSSQVPPLVQTSSCTTESKACCSVEAEGTLQQ